MLPVFGVYKGLVVVLRGFERLNQQSVIVSMLCYGICLRVGVFSGFLLK